MILYWSRNTFTLGHTVQIMGNSPQRFNDIDIKDQVARVVNMVQAFGVDTIYVDSQDDLIFLPMIKESLIREYSYNKDVKMGVKR